MYSARVQAASTARPSGVASSVGASDARGFPEDFAAEGGFGGVRLSDGCGAAGARSGANTRPARIVGRRRGGVMSENGR